MIFGRSSYVGQSWMNKRDAIKPKFPVFVSFKILFPWGAFSVFYYTIITTVHSVWQDEAVVGGFTAKHFGPFF